MRDSELLRYKEEVSKIHDGVVVEVGCYIGRSLRHIAPTALANGNKVYAVDLWDWEKMDDGIKAQLPDPIDVFAIFRVNMVQERLFDHIEVIREDSVVAAADFEDESIDLVFLDTSHDRDHLKAEIEAWRPKVKYGGTIMGHDYGQMFDGVVNAVLTCLGPPSLSRTVWVVKRQAA
jgi:predicted O-methyltransferase YrrM